MPEIVKSLITPNDKTLRSIFEAAKCYHVDIYQREYKWTEENVKTLLNDIELRFNLCKRTQIEPAKIQQDVIVNFEPYFLNTFLVNATTENVSIVDGQQRLTTFLIILIKLYKLVKEVTSNQAYKQKSFSPVTLEKLIFEANDFGTPSTFKIHNGKREAALNIILNDNNQFTPEDETQARILENYKTISGYYDKYFNPKGTAIDVKKLTYYITYLLDKLSIVEVKIEKKKNIAMIFEVVNDRGKGLQPYEILKGKLLGNLDDQQKEEANEIWTDLQNRYYNSTLKNSTESGLDLDMFFRTYLRAKFANSEGDYEKYSDKYHYEIYRNEELRRYFGNFEDRDLLYNRVVKDIKYFADLYLKLRTSYKYEHLIYNKLLDQNQQYLLIMSNIVLDDPQEEAKIKAISKKFDQVHTTLRLLDSYESNTFQEFIYDLNKLIREKDINQANCEFDKKLIDYLVDEAIIQKGVYSSTSDLFRFDLFQNMHNRWTNFTKYVLMRIDRYFAKLLDMPSYAAGTLEDVEERFNKNNRKRYGMHLEHIYANNDKNEALFKDKNGAFNESLFNQTRNQLGVVLLLKDAQNLSSGNDYYKKKFNTYKQSGLIWNELMVGHVGHIDLRNLNGLKITKIDPDKNGLFPLSSVPLRQKETFEVIKKLWGF